MCNIKYMYFNVTITTLLYFFPNSKKIIMLSSMIKTDWAGHPWALSHGPCLMEFRNHKHKKISNDIRQFEVCQLIANNK